MDAFGKSQSMRRVEDQRFLTGEGRYVDDIAPENAAHVLFFRSPVAHANIVTLDLDEARAAEGVLAILTVEDLEEAGIDPNMQGTRLKNRDGSDGAGPARPCLAKGRVRFVGEPIVAIVAETLAQAKDAVDLIAFDFEELDPHVDPTPGGPVIHDEAPDNVALDYWFGDQAKTDAAFAAAKHHLTYEISDNRIICNSMEPRGAYAEWDGARMHLCFGGQGVWGMKDHLAANYGLDREQIRVTNPDVGGGFGMKGMPYPEYLVLPHAARVVGGPVRWMSERTEAMLTDNAGRDLVSTAELALDENLKIIGYRVSNIFNLGAYNSYFAQAIQSELFIRVLMGTYDVQAACLRSRAIYTNTTQVDAYRGAGRPEAIYVLERTMDYAARDLGIDPWD